MGEDDDESDDESGFPRALLAGGGMRTLALARKAWFDERGLEVARFLAAARVFTGLSREQLLAAYDIVLDTDELRSNADQLTERDDVQISQITRDKWDAACRGELHRG